MTEKEIDIATKKYTRYKIWQVHYKEGATFVNEIQPYTAEDFEKYGEWMSVKGWCHSPFKKVWYNRFNETVLTFSQLLKLWEESKNG